MLEMALSLYTILDIIKYATVFSPTHTLNKQKHTISPKFHTHQLGGFTLGQLDWFFPLMCRLIVLYTTIIGCRPNNVCTFHKYKYNDDGTPLITKQCNISESYFLAMKNIP